MSIKKYTNVNVCDIHARAMVLLGLKSKTALAERLGISIQNLKNREDRGVNKMDDVELLCSREGLDRDWVFVGEGDPFMFCGEGKQPDYDKTDPTTIKIIQCLKGMTEQQKKDVLKYAQMVGVYGEKAKK